MPNPYELDIELQEYHPLESPPPAGEERYELLPGEVNLMVARHNTLAANVCAQWASGFDGPRCWRYDENGYPIEYHAMIGVDASVLAATVPGTNSAVWRPDVEGSGTDFVDTYSAAKA